MVSRFWYDGEGRLGHPKTRVVSAMIHFTSLSATMIGTEDTRKLLKLLPIGELCVLGTSRMVTNSIRQGGAECLPYKRK